MTEVAPLILVCGAPGSGKTTVVEMLADVMAPRSPMLVEKDTFRPFVDKWLDARQMPPSEREGPRYDEIKDVEYAVMADLTRRNREKGVPVLLEGPYSSHVRDVRKWAAYRSRLGDGPVFVVWVDCPEPQLRRQISTRGWEGDSGKLANWPAFVHNTYVGVPPNVDHYRISNTGERSSLAAAVQGTVQAIRSDLRAMTHDAGSAGLL